MPADETFTIELDADAATLRTRIASRTGHFMPTSLLESQLGTLEHIADDEIGVALDAGAPLDVVVAEAKVALAPWVASRR